MSAKLARPPPAPAATGQEPSVRSRAPLAPLRVPMQRLRVPPGPRALGTCLVHLHAQIWVAGSVFFTTGAIFVAMRHFFMGIV